MNIMNIQIDELEDLSKKIDKLLELAKCEKKPAQQFYTAREACALKGGMAWNTFKQERFFQPKGGFEDARLSNNRVWTKESIDEWLPLSDAELPAYHEKYKTGAKPRWEK